MTNEKTELLNKIKEDMVEVMKAKNNPLKLSTLRLLLSETEKEMKRTGVMRLSDEKTQEIISRQLKKLDKEVEAYVAVNRDTSKQEEERKILMGYMPQQLSDEEIKSEVDHAFKLVNNGEIKNAMPYLATKLKGKADMKKVMEFVKEFR